MNNFYCFLHIQRQCLTVTMVTTTMIAIAVMIIPLAMTATLTEMNTMAMKTIQPMTITQLRKITMTVTMIPTKVMGDSQPNEEDAQDIYDELLEQCYPSDYLCAHSDELDYCGSYPQQNDDEYFDDSEDSEDNGQPEVNYRDEYDAWAQGVNNAVLKQSLPFPYIFAHMDDLGYRDGSNSFSSGGSRSSGYSSVSSHHSSSVGYSNNATRGTGTPHGGSIPGPISHSRNSGSGAVDYSRNASGYGPTYPKNTSQAISRPIGHSSNASHGNRTLLYSDQRVNDLSKYIQS